MSVSDTVKFLIALVIGAMVVFGYQTVANWKNAHDREDNRIRTSQATTDIMADGDKSSSARDEANRSGASNRQNFEDSVEQDSRNDRQIASRDATHVPASRLRAFEKRRIERERIACDRLRRSGLECPEGSGSQDAPER